MHGSALRCRDRPDLESEVIPKLEEILHKITFTVNLRNPELSSVPSHFTCPITQVNESSAVWRRYLLVFFPSALFTRRNCLNASRI
jgi:hypothetical protein